MNVLKEGILHNTVRPRVAEKDKLVVSRMMSCSPDLEGDSQLGVMLFIGISSYYGITKTEAIDFTGVEKEEYDFKLKKFNNHYFELMRDLKAAAKVSNQQRKLHNKVRLINNYIRFNSRAGNFLVGNA